MQPNIYLKHLVIKIRNKNIIQKNDIEKKL